MLSTVSPFFFWPCLCEAQGESIVVFRETLLDFGAHWGFLEERVDFGGGGVMSQLREHYRSDDFHVSCIVFRPILTVITSAHMKNR